MAITDFTIDSIPYEQLEKFGLTQQMIEDLPQKVIENILNGKFSPPLPLAYNDENDEKVDLYARFGLIRTQDGNVDVLFIPRLKEKDLEEYNEQQRRFLLAGDVLVVGTPEQNTVCYVQFNEEMNQVITVPVEVIHHNLEIYAHCLAPVDEMASFKLEMVRAGKVTEFGQGENMVTLGVDLNTQKGIRRVMGNEQAWILDKNEGTLSKYNFGIYGCWVLNDSNTLSYVPEAEYTQEMYDQLSRAATQNASSYRMTR